FNDTSEQPHVIDGELDLRDWDFSAGRSIALAGEEEFYPDTLLEDVYSNSTHQSGQNIDVPGDWSRELNPDDSSPYGYGSYHLRILVDAEKDTTFSIRVPSVRSASVLY